MTETLVNTLYDSGYRDFCSLRRAEVGRAIHTYKNELNKAYRAKTKRSERWPDKLHISRLKILIPLVLLGIGIGWFFKDTPHAANPWYHNGYAVVMFILTLWSLKHAMSYIDANSHQLGIYTSQRLSFSNQNGRPIKELRGQIPDELIELVEHVLSKTSDCNVYIGALYEGDTLHEVVSVRIATKLEEISLWTGDSVKKIMTKNEFS